MINTQARLYNYAKLSEQLDSYGQPIKTEEAGTIKMTINFGSEALQEHPLYSGAQYVGLTLDKNVDATYIIQYGEEKLKVLYTNTKGRYTQVYMARM